MLIVCRKCKHLYCVNNKQSKKWPKNVCLNVIKLFGGKKSIINKFIFNIIQVFTFTMYTHFINAISCDNFELYANRNGKELSPLVLTD